MFDGQAMPASDTEIGTGGDVTASLTGGAITTLAIARISGSGRDVLQLVAHQQPFLHNRQTIVFTSQIVQTGGRQPEPVSGLLGGEEGGCFGVLIAEHDGAMLASKCEIYQVNSGKLGLEVAVKLLAPGPI